MPGSNYLNDAVLAHILTAVPFASPNATLYLALFKADPTPANISANEVSNTVDDTAYARQPIAFLAPSGNTCINSNLQQFLAVIYGTGAVSYDATYIGVYDSQTGGNLLYSKALVSPINRVVGESLSFPIGSITVSQS